MSEKMKTLVAVAEIEYVKNKTKEFAAPGSVFEIEESVAVKLPKGAAREPSDAELALYEKQKKPATAAPKADDGGEGSTGSAGGKRKAADI